MAIKEIQNLWIFEERNTDNMFTELRLEMCCRTGGNGRKYYQHQTLFNSCNTDLTIFVPILTFMQQHRFRSHADFLGRADIEWRWAMYQLATGYLGPVAYAMAKNLNKSWKRSRKHTVISLIGCKHLLNQDPYLVIAAVFLFLERCSRNQSPKLPKHWTFKRWKQGAYWWNWDVHQEDSHHHHRFQRGGGGWRLEPVIPTWSKPWDAFILGLKLP